MILDIVQKFIYLHAVSLVFPKINRMDIEYQECHSVFEGKLTQEQTLVRSYQTLFSFGEKGLGVARLCHTCRQHTIKLPSKLQVGSSVDSKLRKNTCFIVF